MKRTLEELYQKYEVFHEKFKDEELDDYLLSLVPVFEESTTMYHQFGYLLMHIKATIAHQVRPRHLQEAIERAEKFLKRWRGEEKA